MTTAYLIALTALFFGLRQVLFQKDVKFATLPAGFVTFAASVIFYFFSLSTGSAVIIGATYGLASIIWQFLLLQDKKKDSESLEDTIEKRIQSISQEKEEIEQKAKELTELDSVKTRFYENVNHDLRTPLMTQEVFAADSARL